MEKKIDVMIVGAQKAGTTSLLRYLSEHPECVGHPQKEFAYFVDSAGYGNSYSEAFSKYFSNYTIDNKKKIIAKSAAIYCDEAAIKKLYEHNPECQIILIYRNPVERTYSSFLMEKNYGKIKIDFSELPRIIEQNNTNKQSWEFNFFIEYGLYAKYLQILTQYFPKEQISIFLYEDLNENALKVCQDIFEKINVNKNFIPQIKVKHNVTQMTRSSTIARVIKHILRKNGVIRNFLMLFIPKRKAYKYGELLRSANKTAKKYNQMDLPTKNYLTNFYKNSNIQLEKMINRDLSSWNK